MDYQYIPPVPRVHRVTVDGHLKTYEGDLWTWGETQEEGTQLTPKVKDWLAQHQPKARVICDRGDWGEGTPIFWIDFPSKAGADAFQAEFAKPAAVDLELRTCRMHADPFYPDLIVDQGSIRVPNAEVMLILRQVEDAPMTIDADDQGEYLQVVFSTPENRIRFGSDMWKVLRAARSKFAAEARRTKGTE